MVGKDEERLRFGGLSRRGGEPPSTAVARSRTSAYVYGNILVLAAVAALDEHAVRTGAAVLAAVATGVTTYVAHVFAEDVGQRIGRCEQEHGEHVRQELRDATPTLTSGVLPAAALALGWAGWVPVHVAQWLAIGVVVVRLGGMGLLVERLSGRRASAASFWSGIGVAVAGALIAALKLAVAH